MTLEPTEKMFFENANVQHPRRHHEFFLRSRPYRGEPPTVAGFLLYPDTPAKMETTSREAFCFRPIPRQSKGKGDCIAENAQQQSELSHPAVSGRTGRGNSCREPTEDEHEIAEKHEEDTREMRSQYQKDFPPPTSCRRRRTPALPQPDNIGINPAFRIEFNTVQRETYPGWAITNPKHTGRLRAASSRQQSSVTSEK